MNKIRSLVSSYHSNRTLGHQICTKADLFASYSALSLDLPFPKRGTS